MEMMKIIGGRSGRAWPVALRLIASSRRAGRRVVLYVPEQMTLQTERDIISHLHLKGLLDIEVISPRKLRLLVRESTGGNTSKALDEAGQIMAVHRAMTEQGKALSFYREMTGLPGAVGRVREAVAELLESEMTPEEMEAYAEQAATGAAQAKIRDLKLIRESYEALVSEKFEDGKRAWTDTVNRLARTDILRDAELIVYGFDTVRPDLRELLCAALPLAARVWVFLTMDIGPIPDAMLFQEQHRSVEKLDAALRAMGTRAAVYRVWRPRQDGGDMLKWMDDNLFARNGKKWEREIGDEITLYAAADRGDEAEQTAECLLKWHEQGIPWERMAIALPAGSALEGVLRSRLRLSGIPFCSTEKIPAVSHGVFRLLNAAMEGISNGYTAELMTEAALSGFTTLTEEEALEIGNYAEAHGIEGTARWLEPFTRGADAEKAERIRRKLTAPFEHLRSALRDAKTGTESVEALMAFLEEEGVRKRLKEREEMLLAAGLYREAVTDRQVWKLMTELLDQLWTLLGSRRATIQDLRSMLESATGTLSVSTLPETESGVVLGEIGHMLPGDTDALILPGCQEGILTAPESGWLTDREREELEKGTNREVGISRERRGWIRKYDFYRTVTVPRRYLRLSWSIRDEKGSPMQEDSVIDAVRGVFPGITVAGGVRGTATELRPRTPLKALESMGTLFAALQEGQRNPEAESAAVALLYSGVYGRTAKEMAAEAEGGQEAPALEAETAARLFRTEGISISRLERFAACPYQHFIDYGLRPVEQETFEFDSADAGSFFHAALEGYIKTAGEEPDWPGLEDARVDEIMDAVCAEQAEAWEGGPLREDALGIWQGEEYLRRVHHAARVLTRFAANSEFRTIATEQGFGRSGSGLPPLVLKLKDGSRVAVQGIIDRIDTYENGEGVWLRVVDYKSSEKKPEPAKMADGEQLQLMIYLRAAERAYPGTRPAGAMFFPVRDNEITAAEETPEALEDERLKKVRMKGLVTAEPEIIRAMDRDRSPYSLDEVFRQDGTLRKSADWVVEETVLEGLMDAAEEKAAEICGEIRRGRIEAAPRGTEETAPCRFCTYRTLCHRRRDSLRPREDGITWQDIARKNTLREEEK